MTQYEVKDDSTEMMDMIRLITNYEKWDDADKVYWIQSYLMHWATKEKIMELMH